MEETKCLKPSDTRASEAAGYPQFLAQRKPFEKPLWFPRFKRRLAV